jgi:hypothetical protein
MKTLSALIFSCIAVVSFGQPTNYIQFNRLSTGYTVDNRMWLEDDDTLKIRLSGVTYKIPTLSGALSFVTSFNGRTGAITPATNDYTWAQIDKTTSSLADITTRNFSDLQNKPTTLSGYGITDAQPLDSDLTAIAGLSPSNDDIIQRKAGAWTNRTVAQFKSDLGLTNAITGTLSTGRIPYATGASALADGPYWDSANERLGIGTASPSTNLMLMV